MLKEGRLYCRFGPPTNFHVAYPEGTPVFENTYFTFFSYLKNMTFYIFFEMTCQKVVKSH